MTGGLFAALAVYAVPGSAPERRSFAVSLRMVSPEVAESELQTAAIDVKAVPDEVPRGASAAIEALPVPLVHQARPPPVAEIATQADPPEAHAPSPQRPTAEVVADEAKSNYWSTVYAAVSEELRYPAVARRRGQQGEATILLAIGADGRLKNVIEKPDSSGIFSRAAVRAAERAAPYPAPPSELGGSVELPIPVLFRLE